MPNLELTPSQWHTIHSFLRERSDLYIGDETQCRRFIAAVLWIARAGAPWRMLPAEYGKWNSIYRRYANWRHRVIWAALHQHLADDPDTEYLIIDSTVVRAHPDAAGAPKKGASRRPGVRAQSGRVQRQSTYHSGRVGQSFAVHPDGRPGE